jgi:hypothetical protein
MLIVIRIIFTVAFGLLWWWVYNHVGPGLAYLMILGSVLAVCACCCRSGDPRSEWSYEHYLACIRRCWLATVTLMVGLFILGIIVVMVMGGGLGGAMLANILMAAIGAPLFVRLICCAFDS